MIPPTRAEAAVLRVRAPAKVNLDLRILGRRPDGYHDIESWVVLIEWCDELVFQHSPGGLRLHVHGFDGLIPAGPENLVWKAAALLAEASRHAPDVSIDLHKAIPPGAGLGGGSSDAAAALVSLHRLWRLEWPQERLVELAARLGSDVPLFIGGQQAILQGRGERLSPLAPGWNGWLVLIAPPWPVSTAEVYRRWSDGAPGDRPWPRPWRSVPCSARELSAQLHNDLLRPALSVEPRLGDLLESLAGAGFPRFHLTGSGSTLFAPFDTSQEAREWTDRAAKHCGPSHLVRLAGVLQPAPGGVLP
jgi:4-diphosphocytidyl-2-C-methyl-D-erythritol kinase